MILALFILEVIFGMAAIILCATNKDWESMLFLALCALCMIVGKII